MAGPVEATALGNVLVQAMAAGDLGSLQDIREVVRHSESITEFVPARNSGWDEAWQRFQQLQ
jgi:rhamnulokinase